MYQYIVLTSWVEEQLQRLSVVTGNTLVHFTHLKQKLFHGKQRLELIYMIVVYKCGYFIRILICHKGKLAIALLDP